MKLNFKDLKQQKFTIDAEPTETIGEVKQKIAAEKGWDAAQQKLIYSGKILADTNTVESYKIEEKGFIVCMVSKPKTAPAPKAAAAPPPSTPAVSSSTPTQPPAPVHNASAAPSNPPATPTPASSAPPTDAAASWNDPSALLVGQRSEAAISEMMAMGFERPQVMAAMRAAFNNPDRAMEYLMDGIPEHLQREQAPPSAGSAAAAPAPPTTGATTASPVPATAATGGGDEPINLFEAAAQHGQGGRGAGAGGPGTGAGAGGGAPPNMDFLRQSPHFQHLRQLVQQQPAMLEPILQQVADGNPQLAQMIGQNQEQFLQLLSEDIGGEAIGGMGEAGPMPPGAVPVSVTEEERDAIERLCRLGFPRDQVVQAYFACDKNEELAANFLFEQPDDDQD